MDYSSEHRSDPVLYSLIGTCPVVIMAASVISSGFISPSISRPNSPTCHIKAHLVRNDVDYRILHTRSIHHQNVPRSNRHPVRCLVLIICKCQRPS